MPDEGTTLVAFAEMGGPTVKLGPDGTSVPEEADMMVAFTEIEGLVDGSEDEIAVPLVPMTELVENGYGRTDVGREYGPRVGYSMLAKGSVGDIDVMFAKPVALCEMPDPTVPLGT